MLVAQISHSQALCLCAPLQRATTQIPPVQASVVRLSLWQRENLVRTALRHGWLSDNWNGRFLATSNGGTGGYIDYTNLAHGVSLGVATFGTKAGQYGQADTGGRQGFEEAILYHEDFDGIQGPMGVDWLHVVAYKDILARRQGWPDLESLGYITAAHWSAIVAAQIKLFDPHGGFTDGTIDNMSLHNLEPSMFACSTGILNDSTCLAAAQVNTVRKIYQPLADSSGSSGKIVYPAFGLGASTSVFLVNIKVINGTTVPAMVYTLVEDHWRGAVYNSSTWKSRNFSTTDMDLAVCLHPGTINIAGGTSHNVSTYHGYGEKLLA
ncbi:uncharacterized protein CC84DRAFT_1174819 [Paraphaeosphaeria sporulosa]|uniref:Carboxylic ester hydrolase n=1 Tax=Paraphaeosphaeria sporulosa TaxID=1460663 RepID=A0A177CI36_9PLEO|nr:uncharacterized protein CC84DRAFT_1174819 [Paraphaeosphaeria sporulosa]OAG06921.1 hypothetical protein CC84DRAFT_1174819 [Paraphaeosphaeria sporulosa]